MKTSILLILFLSFISCSKKADSQQNLSENFTLDSMNKIIERKNDSITILNNTNRYEDWSGKHKLTHNSILKNGEINFEKIGRDEYKVSGKIISGQNNVKINGILKLVSEDYMNLDGEIIQNITQDGAAFIRKDKNTFKKEGKYWRLQNKMNGAGFVDYIDIFK